MGSRVPRDVGRDRGSLEDGDNVPQLIKVSRVLFEDIKEVGVNSSGKHPISMLRDPLMPENINSTIKAQAYHQP